MIQNIAISLNGLAALVAVVSSNRQAAALRKLRRQLADRQRVGVTALEDQQHAAERELRQQSQECLRLADDWEANQTMGVVCARQLRALVDGRQAEGVAQ